MFVIGLTGGIASGKSTVAGILKELGAVVLDADEVARKVVEKGEPAYREIIEVFGREVLDEEGRLDRNLLGRIVFQDPVLRKKLEKIIHPRVKDYFEAELKRIESSEPEKVVVLDVPLLLESGMQEMVDEVWVVSVSQETQIERIVERDRMLPEDALKRIKAQMPLEEKLKYADRIISTDCSLVETREQVLKHWEEVTGYQR